MRNEFTAIFEFDDRGAGPSFFAICPEVPGAAAEGKTIDEARANLEKSIKKTLEEQREKTMREILFDLPPDTTREIIAVQETIALY